MSDMLSTPDIHLALKNHPSTELNPVLTSPQWIPWRSFPVLLDTVSVLLPQGPHRTRPSPTAAGPLRSPSCHRTTPSRSTQGARLRPAHEAARALSLTKPLSGKPSQPPKSAREAHPGKRSHTLGGAACIVFSPAKALRTAEPSITLWADVGSCENIDVKRHAQGPRTRPVYRAASEFL